MTPTAEPAAHRPSQREGAGWRARLSLGFTRHEGKTILSRREHLGPLRVQKPLYPEGEPVCHAIVLHPPSGIAGGDQLDIEVDVAAGAHALLTTPGAGKWYRSGGPRAGQRLHFTVATGGVLEWLPQETIVFDGALADIASRFDLADAAGFIGWEVLCLGRRAARETFRSGELRLETRLRRAGQPIWLERGRLAGGSPLLDSPAGLAGASVVATLLAVGPGLDADLTAACREVGAPEAAARHGVTRLPDILVARYLGHSSEAARHWLAGLWQVLRPAVAGRAATTPRIWNT